MTTGLTAYLPWSIETYDASGMHDPVTNPERITITVPGKYLVVARLHCSLDGLQARVRKNRGATVLPASVFSRVADDHVIASGIVDCAAADYLEVWAFNSNAASRTIFSGANASSFQAHYLGV